MLSQAKVVKSAEVLEFECSNEPLLAEIRILLHCCVWCRLLRQWDSWRTSTVAVRQVKCDGVKDAFAV